jgi:hypothetical protein
MMLVSLDACLLAFTVTSYNEMLYPNKQACLVVATGMSLEF